jgi:hypothetical protein
LRQASAQRSPTLGDVRLRFDAGGGRFLDHLLVAALHRAVALAQIDRVAVLVGEHLDFDVARVLEELLHVHRGVVEGGPASARVMVTALSSAASVCTTRMPRPPPPPAALMITG